MIRMLIWDSFTVSNYSVHLPCRLDFRNLTFELRESSPDSRRKLVPAEGISSITHRVEQLRSHLLVVAGVGARYR